MPASLSRRDLDQLAAAGIDAAEADRQLALLAAPPAPIRLARPCTVGDGILRLTTPRQAELARLGAAARDAGRLGKFVPASGAATRMFGAPTAARERGLTASRQRLAAAAAAGDADAAATLGLLDGLARLALARPLAARLGVPLGELADLAARDSPERLLASLLDPDGLDAARLPKALLPFHLEDGRPVTAFEEQLAEGLPYLADAAGRARFHFTVPPGEAPRFAALLAGAGARLAPGLAPEVVFSEQNRATDTLCLDEAGLPARTAGGDLLLRPAGHGALLGNLAATGGDLVVIKNIDNILPRQRHAEIARWKLILAGLAVEQLAAASGRAAQRPLRVCGVVANSGEPGGGPFWVAGKDGRATPQIVEASQVAAGDPAQLALFAAATHFNPVDLVAALRRPDGGAWELGDFVDARTAFVSTKSDGGQSLRVLERPGLWNGAMAGWRTIFVEVPASTFAPVKTVLDLLRPEHATSG